ncbi:uncharacterized protein LOC128728611 [Anopheles nili]|uniref:uncharacterized protein LOC128728611 n=1 Tax=Anopheles nili TaxID=185578 RepID=UPI00237A2253|nr:uncharacterized protein LOC128728611 [Anopheles nili]
MCCRPVGWSSFVVLGVLARLSLVFGGLLNDSTPAATTGARDARFLALGDASEEFSLYPTYWSSADFTGESTDGYDTTAEDDGEFVRLEEGGSDLNPDPYELDRPGQYGLGAGSYGSDGRYQELTSGDTSRTPLDEDSPYYPPMVADQSQDEPVVMAPPPSVSRVSEFVRGMLQRFGVYQYIEAYQNKGTTSSIESPVSTTDSTSTGGLTSHIQRIIPHRFRPHFVNTDKGLRNIPAQLNDGQLQLAPEDGTTGTTTTGQQNNGQSGKGTGAGAGGKTPGSTSTIGSLFSNFKRKLKAIYPGTVWCGDGNQAKSEDDIGFFYLTDTCCRAHDLCPITIAAGEQFNRLKNNGYFTRSHCDCDTQFFNCLKNANTLVSRQIGYTYFNLLKPQCFRFEHPKLNCTKRSKGKCQTYVVDEKQSKQWQWFDNLIF